MHLPGTCTCGWPHLSGLAHRTPITSVVPTIANTTTFLHLLCIQLHTCCGALVWHDIRGDTWILLQPKVAVSMLLPRRIPPEEVHRRQDLIWRLSNVAQLAAPAGHVLFNSLWRSLKRDDCKRPIMCWSFVFIPMRFVASDQLRGKIWLSNKNGSYALPWLSKAWHRWKTHPYR